MDYGIMDNREGYHAMMAGICLIQMNPGRPLFVGIVNWPLIWRGARDTEGGTSPS